MASSPPQRFTAWGWGVGGHYQCHKKYKTEGKGSRRRKIVKKYGIQPNFLLTRDASAWYDKVSDQWHVSVPKWGESESGRKSEISLIWCISTTNNVKSCKIFNETAQTANFTDFLLTSCENRPKWPKSMKTQMRRVRLQKFLRGIQICHMKAVVLENPKMWWFFYSIIF